MTPLLLCSECRRHVRSDETVCPFCSGPVVHRDVPELRAVSAAATGRAALFAMVAAGTLPGCSSSAAYGAPAPPIGLGGAYGTSTGGAAGSGQGGVAGQGASAGGAAPALGTGDACSDDSQCPFIAGTQPVCMKSWPNGGACTSDHCSGNDQCTTSAACGTFMGEKRCFQVCSAGLPPCRSGYDCMPPGVCLPKQ